MSLFKSVNIQGGRCLCTKIFSRQTPVHYSTRATDPNATEKHTGFTSTASTIRNEFFNHHFIRTVRSAQCNVNHGILCVCLCVSVCAGTYTYLVHINTYMYPPITTFSTDGDYVSTNQIVAHMEMRRWRWLNTVRKRHEYIPYH